MSVFGPVRRNRRGRFVLTLSDGERAVLAQLPADLKALLADPDDPSLRRLFPAAYGDDAERSEEFRRLMQADLVERHAAALDVMAGTARATELSEDEAGAWLSALNQLRLVLGTRLDVSEDDDPARATTPERQMYYYLGYLQESVVDALSRA
ncbi:MAG: DUF2017 family protein [Acidimicrobiales bacterium]